jgi:hypothetical protein
MPQWEAILSRIGCMSRESYDMVYFAENPTDTFDQMTVSDWKLVYSTTGQLQNSLVK